MGGQLMAKRGPAKRSGPNALQIITWVIVVLVVASMILSVLPIAQQ
jgi:hypothetical protein